MRSARPFLAALRQWPAEGLPTKPEAWLLATARRRLVDAQRHGQVRRDAVNDLTSAFAAAQAVVDAGADFPDERLGFFLVCAHPAIDPAARTPLMLQTVLGVEAARITSAFLTSPASMSQRLVRAKAKIRVAGIPFAVPPREEWPERVAFVLDAIYAAYTTGWDETRADAPGAGGLATEALWLARVFVHLLPDEPEALGLLAPRFQIEAAIQSVHAQRARTGETNWEAIALFYEALVRHTPALGAQIGRAVALACARGAAAGLAALDTLPPDILQTHQPLLGRPCRASRRAPPPRRSPHRLHPALWASAKTMPSANSSRGGWRSGRDSEIRLKQPRPKLRKTAHPGQRKRATENPSPFSNLRRMPLAYERAGRRRRRPSIARPLRSVMAVVGSGATTDWLSVALIFRLSMVIVPSLVACRKAKLEIGRGVTVSVAVVALPPFTVNELLPVKASMVRATA